MTHIVHQDLNLIVQSITNSPFDELIHSHIQPGCASATESTVKLMSGGRILCHLQNVILHSKEKRWFRDKPTLLPLRSCECALRMKQHLCRKGGASIGIRLRAHRETESLNHLDLFQNTFRIRWKYSYHFYR